MGRAVREIRELAADVARREQQPGGSFPTERLLLRIEKRLELLTAILAMEAGISEEIREAVEQAHR